MLKIQKDWVLNGTLDSEIWLLHDLKEKALAAQTAVELQQEKVIDLLRLEGQKSRTATTRLGRFRATVVQGQTVKYNEAGLKKALGADLWKKVTKQVLDKALLEDKVSTGDIDIHVVAEHTTVKDNKPYVRITPVSDDEET